MTLAGTVNTTWHSVQPHGTRGLSRIAVVNPVQEPNWDGVIASYPQASFFHGAAWTRTLQAAYGYEPKHFVADDEAGVRFVVPLMEVRSHLTGARGISMPFSDFCEPLVRDAAASAGLCDSLVEFGRERGWKYVECRGGRVVFPHAVPSASFYTHAIDLRCSEEELWMGCAPATRRAVRKAEMSGIAVESSSAHEAVKAYYELHCRTRRKHGLPPQPWSFFQALFDHAISKESGVVFLARHGGRHVAGALFVHFGRKAVFKYGASNPETLNLRANNHVMWEAIRWYARRGFSELNLGRTEIENGGLRRYKLGWRVEEQVQNYYRFDYTANAFVVAGEKAPSPLARSLFRWMPPRPARLFGALLYKHVA